MTRNENALFAMKAYRVLIIMQSLKLNILMIVDYHQINKTLLNFKDIQTIFVLLSSHFRYESYRKPYLINHPIHKNDNIFNERLMEFAKFFRCNFNRDSCQYLMVAPISWNVYKYVYI